MAPRPRQESAAFQRSHPPSPPQRPEDAPFKVRALEMGYYGEKRRRVGDVFLVEPAAFSKKWMERVDARTPERITTGNEEIRRKHDEELAARHQPGIHTGPDDVHDPPTGNANPLGDVE